MEQTGTEAELESFRKQWQEEVTRKSKGKDSSRPRPSAPPAKGSGSSSSGAGTGKQLVLAPPSAADSASREANQADSFEGYSYLDLGSKEEALKLGAGREARQAAVGSEPKTALDHYEKAVEKEAIGSLGDSISLYRKAFKLDDGVHEAYKQKHFAASWNKPAAGAAPPPGPAATTAATAPTTTTQSKPSTVEELIESFAGLAIPATQPETNLSKPLACPIGDVPFEILENILQAVAGDDPATLARLAPVCKRLAFLVTTSDSMWKALLWSRAHGLGAMHYRYACDFKGAPLLDAHPCRLAAVPDLTPATYPDYRAQYRHRPRLRFGGCYISTVNYTRPGGHSLSHYGDDGRPSRHAWTSASPVHIVTYYRYLRFYRDGTVISLLTTSEPADVVPFLSKDHAPEQVTLKTAGGREHHHHRPRHAQHETASAGPSAGAAGALPQHVMKEALLGRWRLSGPASGPSPSVEVDEADEQADGMSRRPGEYAKEPAAAAAAAAAPTSTTADGTAASSSTSTPADEEEGTVHVETQGVVPKYMWKMAFGLGSAGRRDGTSTRNNRLAWKGFWSYNRLTDDWGEFGLKNDRPFYWSRVKSYGVGA